jgi:hypothetical protein
VPDSRHVSNLTAADTALLSAMMATIGAIWAIGFVAYTLVYQNFRSVDNLPNRVENITMNREHGGKDIPTVQYWERQRIDVHDRLGRYAFVFRAYLVSGAYVFLSIVISGAALAYDRPDLIPLAGSLFLLTLSLLVAALSYEVWTSYRYVTRLRMSMRR